MMEQENWKAKYTIGPFSVMDVCAIWAAANPLDHGEWELLAETPCGENIRAMTKFEGTVYVATEHRVYWLDADAKVLRPVEFIEEKE